MEPVKQIYAPGKRYDVSPLSRGVWIEIPQTPLKEQY